MRETHDFLSLPLLVRPHSVIAVGSNDERPDYDFADGVTFQVYELADGAGELTAVVPALDGSPALTLTAGRSGPRIAVQAVGQAANWRVLLVGITQTASVEGGSSESAEHGLLVTPELGTHSLTIVLSPRVLEDK